MIEVGSKYNVEKVVTDDMTAAAIGSGALPVFGTPFMLGMMENAALQCLQAFLQEGQGSVGIHLDVSHDAPTPVGMTVRAEAEITSVSGKLVEFRVKAWDDAGLIGQGSHRRAVIQNDRFLEKCNAKTAGTRGL
ncbi:MAG: thioesterase family protein [Oscillospiraceae bacterium]